MKLQSKQLTFIRYTDSHFQEYKLQAMNEEVMKYINGKPCTEEEAKEKWQKIMTANSMDDIFGYFSVRRNEDNDVIGLAKLLYYGSEKGLTKGKETGTVEVGYSLMPEFWGKGYATEITEFFTEFAKSYDGIKEVIAIINPDNGASRRVLEKCGYTLYSTELFNGTSPSEWYKTELK
ncbi:MAG: GNAT family N-acetyltransferase [Ignavibacteria bacterium]|nr:GNAT family N-acetyltransferase [Ignavibacteria bacterium]